MLTAITRAVSRSLAECQLEHFEREPIDVEKAAAQHRAYQACLADLGAHVIALPAANECPDGVFVEDPAMVLDEIAIVTRMGNVTRRAESDSLAQAVAEFRGLKRIVEPGTLEGGDVMRIGKTLYVGLSRRTNREGIAQLAAMVEPFGYRVVAVEVRGCLHLKSACCFVGDGTILANRGWIDAGHFAEFKILDLPNEESRGANVLRLGETVIVPAAFPKTAEALERAGFKTRQIDTSELLKAEAGVTCMSLLFDA
jgi:dimethylargininase